MRALLAAGRLPRAEHRRLALAVALSAAATAAAVALLSTSGYLISRAAQRPQILELMVAIVAVRAFGLARATLRYAERLCSHDLALRQLARLRVRFYERLWPLVPGQLRRGGGDLLARFVGDVDALSDLYLRALTPALVAVVVIAGAGAAAWLMLPAAGLVLLVSLVLAAATLPWLSAAVGARSDRRQAGVKARLTGELVESIDGADELRMLGCAGERMQVLAASDTQLSRLARTDALAASLAGTLGGVFNGAGLLAVLVVGLDAVHSGSLAGVLLAALAFLALGAYEGIAPLPAAARSLRTCAVAARRLHAICAQQPAVLDPSAPRRANGAGELRVEHLGFRYEPEQRWLFEELELSLAAGERVAVVGPSGVGKSTLGELLVRFRDPQQGRVTLDGVDVRELTQEELRSAVVLCSQDASVFNTTLRENLLLARRDAGEEELWRALACVELDGWARSLPEGLDTLVGADGELVSGGQRQRIVLARALLACLCPPGSAGEDAQARFLILDEPTAHLDAALARRVMRRLLGACPRQSILVITHDPALLSGAGHGDGWERTVRITET
ncbi:MAG TPA: thiol reductant ABC exporter subunit CydC [Solirubrobacteraceae bacterium]|nr:thiol reductant ABC exporter subunit CydC [Solirubrobacteraceae bacterium]